jgi:hypothetical protein
MLLGLVALLPRLLSFRLFGLYHVYNPLSIQYLLLGKKAVELVANAVIRPLSKSKLGTPSITFPVSKSTVA